MPGTITSTSGLQDNPTKWRDLADSRELALLGCRCARLQLCTAAAKQRSIAATFKRSVAKNYPTNWTKYVVMKNKYKVAHLYDENPEETNKALKYYNEFEK